MSSTERVAELQRIVYGAGATDGERAAAAGELEALRRAAAAGVEVGEAESPSATRPGGSPTSGGSPTAGVHPFDGLADLGAVTEETPHPASNPVRVAAIASVVALAIGFGGGWLLGAQSASHLALPGPTLDEDVTFDLQPAQREEVARLGDVAAMAVFGEPQEATDLPGFSIPGIDPLSYRLLANLPDGATIHAAYLQGPGQVCLHVEKGDLGANSICVYEHEFAADGITLDSVFDAGSFRVTWLPSGDLVVGDSGTAS